MIQKLDPLQLVAQGDDKQTSVCASTERVWDYVANLLSPKGKEGFKSALPLSKDELVRRKKFLFSHGVRKPAQSIIVMPPEIKREDRKKLRIMKK